LNTFLKTILHAIFLTIAFPLALTSRFGCIEPLFRFWTYRLTPEECSMESRVEFGSFFAHPQAKVARGVYIDSDSVLSPTLIGDRTEIGSGVGIRSTIGANSIAVGNPARVVGSTHERPA
jgi:hypothetical protein